MDQLRRGNYDSGQDYVLEYGELRFTFNERDFSERVEQAGVKLGFVDSRLDGHELEDLVNLTVNGEVRPRLGARRARQRLLARDRRPRGPLARALAAPPRLPLAPGSTSASRRASSTSSSATRRTPSATCSRTARLSPSSSAPSRTGTASPTRRASRQRALRRAPWRSSPRPRRPPAAPGASCARAEVDVREPAQAGELRVERDDGGLPAERRGGRGDDGQRPAVDDVAGGGQRAARRRRARPDRASR